MLTMCRCNLIKIDICFNTAVSLDIIGKLCALKASQTKTYTEKKLKLCKF